MNIARNCKVFASLPFRRGLNGAQGASPIRLLLSTLRPVSSVATRTVMKMFDIPPGGTITREIMEKYATEERDLIKNLNPVEAENVYKGLMAVSDALGLDKYARDGGMSYTMRELEIARRVSARSELLDINRFVLNAAYFRAMDTNGDGFLNRDDWVKYLKIRKTYTSDEQAHQAFESLGGTSEDGVLSMEEYVKYGTDFWCNLGEDLGSEDFYGTKDLS